MRRVRARAVSLFALTFFLAACNPPASPGPEVADQSSTTEIERLDHCETPGGQAWKPDASVSLDLIGEEGDLRVYAAEYPLPGPTVGLWSQWGQGIALGDGRHLSAAGDHLGEDGNSWFFLYDSADRSLTRVFDVLSVVPHQSGAWGYGKVHAQMVRDECGSIWATTYWGTRRDIKYGDGYEGDRLLEIDPTAETVMDHGAIAGERGMPTMAISEDGHTLVAAGVDAAEDTAILVAYDTRNDTILKSLDDPRQVGFRSLASSQDGEILYSIGNGGLAAFDPQRQSADDAGTQMPGAWLRASTDMRQDGSSYGVTQDDPELFTLARDGTATALGDPAGYTTSLAMADNGRRLFWLPEAHGSAWEAGAGVLEMDTDDGEIDELVRLEPMFEEELGLRAGGTYSIVYDRDSLILGVNASTLEEDSGFGTVVLVVIEGL